MLVLIAFGKLILIIIVSVSLINLIINSFSWIYLLTSNLILLRNDLLENSEKDFILIEEDEDKENEKSFITSLKKEKRLVKKIPDLYVIDEDLITKKNIINIFFFS